MAIRRSQRKKCRTEQHVLPIITIKTQTTTGVSPNVAWNGKNGDVEHKRARKVIQATVKTRHSGDSPDGPRCHLSSPFPFFQLPRELRDQVYSYLVVPASSHGESVIEAATILKNRKKRATAQLARARLNRQRLASGKQPVLTRTTISEPIVHLNLLQASQRMYCEASDCLYSDNWFTISLSKLPSISVETPVGWDLSRIRRLQLELQLKDAPRMNNYIDWPSFFSSFPSLRFLHIIPTFHPRYYDWAQTELCDWRRTHYVHKAFFRELLTAIPTHVDLKLGCLSDPLEFHGRSPVKQTLLEDMYAELASCQGIPRNRGVVIEIVDRGSTK